MITVSLQPFAFRKIVLLIAAVIWLTASVVFADPVFMSGHATRVAQRAESPTQLVANVRTTKSAGSAHDVVEQSRITPAEGPSVFSVSFERLDTWKQSAQRPCGGADELTFWAISLSR